MKSEFINLLTDFIRQAEPDLDSRLEVHTSEVNKIPCTEPIIGKWIDAHDVDFLLAAFALDDDDFAADFPALAHLTQPDRKRIIDAFNNHFEGCVHCSRKASYDSEFNSRVDHVLQKKREELLECLDQEITDKGANKENEPLSVEIAQ